MNPANRKVLKQGGSLGHGLPFHTPSTISWQGHGKQANKQVTGR